MCIDNLFVDNWSVIKNVKKVFFFFIFIQSIHDTVYFFD